MIYVIVLLVFWLLVISAVILGTKPEKSYDDNFVQALERIINRERAYIGEYYQGFSSNFKVHAWERFTYSDMEDKVNGYIKIKDSWHNNRANWIELKDVIFYKDIYKPLKAKVENRYKNKKDK